MLRPACFLGIAEDSGDEFIYYIRTKEKQPQILIRSNIKSRRLNIGTDNECVSNNPSNFLIWLDTLIDKSDTIKNLDILLRPNILPPPPNYPILDGLPQKSSILTNSENNQHAKTQ